MKDAELTTRRLAIIQEIVTYLEDTGKTNIQKIVYFLQESLGIELGYPFRMYHYGPYSDDLDGDLSLSQALGNITIMPDQNGFGYHVMPTDKASGSWPAELSPRREQIGDAIGKLGELSTWMLELYATIHFVSEVETEISREEVLTTVKSLKPKFTEHVIQSAYRNLQKAGLISV